MVQHSLPAAKYWQYEPAEEGHTQNQQDMQRNVCKGAEGAVDCRFNHGAVALIVRGQQRLDGIAEAVAQVWLRNAWAGPMYEASAGLSCLTVSKNVSLLLLVSPARGKL